MDEASLRRLLDGALAHEPPMGPVAQRSLRAGIRLRRRRRARNTAAGLAAVALIVVLVPVVSGALSHAPGGRAFTGHVSTDHHATAYVVNNIGHPGTVTPISETTGRAGQPIPVSQGAGPITITPDGKTGYVSSDTDPGWVIPVNLRTGAPGRPIRAGQFPDQGAVTPDGKTVYVVNIDSSTVTPISTALDIPQEAFLAVLKVGEESQ